MRRLWARAEKKAVAQAKEQQDPVRVKKINYPLIIALVASLVVIALTIILWVILAVDVFFMAWGPHDITFYSEWPVSQFGTDEFFENKNIDGGYSDEVYKGIEQYGEFRFDKLDKEEPIGITQSIVWSERPDDYIDSHWGIDAQYNSGANTVVSAGFNIALTYHMLYEREGFTDEDFEKNGWKAVVIDDGSLAPIHESATSVVFDSAEAGFAAGIAASVYTMSNIIYSATTNDDITIFGGDSFNTVYDWMSGFEQAVNYFNYKVLGVDIYGNLYDRSADTLGLINELGITNVDYKDGFDLTNGFELTPDYSKEFDVNNNSTSGLSGNEFMDTWYNFTFEADPSAESGHMTVERTKNSINNGVSAVFPVAGGGNTILTTSTIDTYSNETNYFTKAIGVDLDGTVADPNNKDYYLGSATKNLRSATGLATWVAEEGGDTSKKKRVPTINGISGNDFVAENDEEHSKGWQISEIDGEPVKGNLFEGDYGNGGVDFTKGIEKDGVTDVDHAFERVDTWLSDNGIDWGISSFNALLDYAFTENLELVGLIENSSSTFTPTGTTPVTESGVAPWIPNWDIYTNTH